MVAIVDTKENKASLNTDRPRRDSVNRVVINLLIIAVVALSVSNIVLAFMAHHYAGLSERNLEIAYIKLYPNGSYERSAYRNSDSQEFLSNTIDGLLKNIVRLRYGVIPETIKNDYNTLNKFLSDPMLNKFVAKKELGGFDAIGVAAAISANSKNAKRVEISNIWVNHYDTVKGVFGGKKDDVVRTNIYYTKTTRNPSGQIEGVPEAKVIPLQWRLITKKELERLAGEDPSFLDYNPIGLEIISGEEQEDPAGLQKTTTAEEQM